MTATTNGLAMTADERAEIARALLALADAWEREGHPEHQPALRLAAAELRATCVRLGLGEPSVPVMATGKVASEGW